MEYNGEDVVSDQETANISESSDSSGEIQGSGRGRKIFVLSPKQFARWSAAQIRAMTRTKPAPEAVTAAAALAV